MGWDWEVWLAAGWLLHRWQALLGLRWLHRGLAFRAARGCRRLGELLCAIAQGQQGCGRRCRRVWTVWGGVLWRQAAQVLFMPPMKLRGLGASPLKVAPLKSKPGCCTHRASCGSTVRQSSNLPAGGALQPVTGKAPHSRLQLTSVWNLSSINLFCSSCWLRGLTSCPASTAGQGSPCAWYTLDGHLAAVND